MGAASRPRRSSTTRKEEPQRELALSLGSLVSMVTVLARRPEIVITMSVHAACRLLEEKLGNPLFYGEQLPPEAGPVALPRLLGTIVRASRAASWVFYEMKKKVLSIRRAGETRPTKYVMFVPSARMSASVMVDVKDPGSVITGRMRSVITKME